MRKFALLLAAAASLALLSPRPAGAQFCSNCIFNSASPQDAQINIGTATIRGTLTASTISVTNLSITNLTATNLAGAGAAITAINASNLGSGTVPSARVAGSYTGITGLGTVTVGTWSATAVNTEHGGTGQNFGAVNAGALPYFNGTGTMATLASPGSQGVLQTAGSGAAPAWSAAPTLTGTNFSAIPLTALASGTLPHSVAVDTNSIAHTNGTGVLGDISGGAAYLTVPLPIANLGSGTLPTSNAASSVTATGVVPIVCPVNGFLCQLNIHSDGRIYSATQYPQVIYSTAIAAGALPSGVTITAAQLRPGTWPSDVVVSSVNNTGTPAGIFGGAAQTITVNAHLDGRVYGISTQNIALPTSQINSGTLPGGVLVPAASVLAGALGPTVIVSSLAVNGSTAGVYGTTATYPWFRLGSDGRITDSGEYSFTGVTAASNTVLSNVAGYVPNQQLDPAVITKVGNTFNSAGNLIQLDGSARIPALNGSLVTNVTGGNVVGSVGTAFALAAAGTRCSSGGVAIGVDQAGNCIRGVVDANYVSGSTNPVQSGAVYTLAQTVGGGGPNTRTSSMTFTTDVAMATQSGAVVIGVAGVSRSTFNSSGDLELSQTLQLGRRGSGGSFGASLTGIFSDNESFKLDQLGGDMFVQTSDSLRNGVRLRFYEPGDSDLTSLRVEVSSFVVKVGGVETLRADPDGTNYVGFPGTARSTFTAGGDLQVPGTVIGGELFSNNGILVLGSAHLEYSGANNLSLGANAGVSNYVTGGQNIWIGDSAGANAGAGGQVQNTVVAAGGLGSCPDCSFNTLVGYQAGASFTSNRLQNVMVGWYAGNENDGSQNTFIGNETGRHNAAGGGNTFVGDFAGTNNNGTGNVFIGYYAGGDVSGDNNLAISNDQDVTPLISGKFDTYRVGIATAIPQHTLEVAGDLGVTDTTADDGSQITLGNGVGGTFESYNGVGGGIGLWSYEGTATSSAPITEQETLGGIYFKGYDGVNPLSGQPSRAQIKVLADNDYANNDQGTRTVFVGNRRYSSGTSGRQSWMVGWSSGTVTISTGGQSGGSPPIMDAQLTVRPNAGLSAIRAVGNMIVNGGIVAGNGTLAVGDGLTVNSSSATITGLLHVGLAHITNACGAGVTTCTASCTGGKYALGGGCNTAAVTGVAVLIGDTGDDFSHTCTTVLATTITADVYCSRVAP